MKIEFVVRNYVKQPTGAEYKVKAKNEDTSLEKHIGHKNGKSIGKTDKAHIQILHVNTPPAAPMETPIKIEPNCRSYKTNVLDEFKFKFTVIKTKNPDNGGPQWDIEFLAGNEDDGGIMGEPTNVNVTVGDDDRDIK